MLNYEPVFLVVCQMMGALPPDQYGLFSPLLQFVTLHGEQYSGRHHPWDDMQPHMSTQVAKELYRAREHPAKHCRDLQPRRIPQLTAPQTREKSAATPTETTCNKIDYVVMQTQRSCTVLEIFSQKDGETEATGTKLICRLTVSLIF